MYAGFIEQLISSITSELAESIKVILVSFTTALVFHYFIEWLKRPRIEIYEDVDKYDPKFNEHYLHVRVVNKRSKLVNRSPAYDCEPEVYVIDAKSEEVKEGSPYSTKWARLTTLAAIPTKNGIMPAYIPINPPAERRINIYPGQMDAGKEGLQLDIIKKEKGKPYCWIHDPQLYVSSNKEKWKLGKGRYYIVVRIRYAGGCSKPSCFILYNESEDPSYVKLKKCQKDEEKRVLDILKKQGFLRD